MPRTRMRMRSGRRGCAIVERRLAVRLVGDVLGEREWDGNVRLDS